jgi:hypothetical protein
VTTRERIAGDAAADVQSGRSHFEIYSQGALGVRWRLLSGNNRDSGRSAMYFVDAEACLSALSNLIDLVEDLAPMHVLASDNRWEWKLSLGNVALATSSRTFDRRLRCVASGQWFVAAARAAEVRPELRIAGERAHVPPPLPPRGATVALSPGRYAPLVGPSCMPDGRAGDRSLPVEGG